MQYSYDDVTSLVGPSFVKFLHIKQSPFKRKRNRLYTNFFLSANLYIQWKELNFLITTLCCPLYLIICSVNYKIKERISRDASENIQSEKVLPNLRMKVLLTYFPLFEYFKEVTFVLFSFRIIFLLHVICCLLLLLNVVHVR